MSSVRIQWNEHGKRFSEGAYYGSVPCYVATTNASFICCEKCGAELYGYWEYWEVQRLNGDFSEYVEYPKKFNTLNKVFAERQRLSQGTHDSMVSETFASKNEFRTGISVCPVCNSELDIEKALKYDRNAFKKYLTNYWAWMKKQASTVDSSENKKLSDLIDKSLRKAEPNPLRYHHFMDGKEVWKDIILESLKDYDNGYEFDVSYYGDYKQGFIDGIFEKLRKEREKKQNEYVNSKIELIETKFDDYAPIDLPPGITNLVAESVGTLKEYVHNVLEIESDYYSVQERLKTLYLEEYSLTQKSAFEIGELTKGPEQERDGLKKGIEDLEKEIGKIDQMTPKDFHIEEPQCPTKPSEPILTKPGLFNKKKVEAANQSLLDQYNQDMKKYDDSMVTYQKQLQDNQERFVSEKEKKKQSIEGELAQKKKKLDDVLKTIQEFDDGSVATPAIASKKIVEEEIAKAEALLVELYQGRENLYSCNVVFGKYRNMVAIASFYEYLMAGRCTSLEGTDGAYNIYENEIRLNQIISQLDTVITSLEQIKENQYVIYSELQEINKSLDSIDKSMKKAVLGIDEINMHNKKMDEYMEEIQKNTAVSAYYSKMNAYYAKKNAQLTKAVAWLVALK